MSKRPPRRGADGPSQGLFRRYRLVLRARVGSAGEDKVVEVLARTQGAARRLALQENPGHVVVELKRVD